MANTVNINSTTWDGYKGSLHYALTSDGTALADLQLIDISGLAPAPNSIKIKSIDLVMNGDWTLFFEADATTDQELERFIGQADVTVHYVRDYSDMPNGGKQASDKAAAGFTSDLLATSANLASGDEFNLLLIFEKDS